MAHRRIINEVTEAKYPNLAAQLAEMDYCKLTSTDPSYFLANCWLRLHPHTLKLFLS